MKKTFIIAGALLAMSFSAHAQLAKIGIKGGLNYANINGSEIQTDAITSYHVGLVAELKLTEKFAVQPELLYSTQGATYKNALTEFKNELGYLAIPVLAKVYLNKTISLELGPQASFLLSEKNDFDIKDSNTFDFSVNAGLGVKITENFFLQGRYNLGLTDVSKDAETKNSVVQVSAGFFF
ncbi:opacity protein-like surface antigen [Flavobacterium sp. 28A]|uniref:porin family protein n=1 Tax=Flavobacterium sp. 28A TaxID=2735895 RepID=UPI0015705019|nr:porin family protein [Flavobacterium sp. 28A]NRT15298.1 opacity protein-like surface antigen [Flavobacterium sp. 28A]